MDSFDKNLNSGDSFNDKNDNKASKISTGEM